MKILLGVPGGIAAYKALEFARLAVKAGHSVRVIQTPASLRFVGRASFAAITGAPVLASEFESDPANGAWPGEGQGTRTPISHLALIESADVLVVAPATANTLARLASGAAEDLVTTSALAATCPVIFAPAMNNLMWDNPATQENVAVLRSRGGNVLEPSDGLLASHGEQGKGRLAEPGDILEAVNALLVQPAETDLDFNGVRVLISAGGTREPIDEVRYIGNRSSGRMGVALADAISAAGGQVTVVGANLVVRPSLAARVIDVSTAAEMQAALEAEFGSSDVLIMAAAVADFVPVKPQPGKIDKSKGAPEILLEPAVDILSALSAARRPNQKIVGFAAEHGDAVERAASKREAKGLDMIVFNDISNSSIGFDSTENEVVLITGDDRTLIPKASKAKIAEAIAAAIADLPCTD
jgi:phosphopantothenoylcysteine decarboxylase/phosphopantothenate--cysteine ligase